MSSELTPSAARSATPRRYGDIKAQRTKAMPGNSLFGSILERLKPEEERALEEMDLKRLSELARAYEAPKLRGQQELPLTEAQRELLQREHGAGIDEWRREFQRQKSNLARTEDRLKELHHSTHYDFDHPLDLLPSGERLRQLQEEKVQQHLRELQQQQQPQRQPWLSRNDLKYSDVMNNVGFRPRGGTVARGFNRDKYADKAPTHRYALIGDVLRPGMDFDAKGRTLDAASQREDDTARTRTTRCSPKKAERMEKMRQMPPKTHIIPGSELEIPVNIKHHYGSKLCENVLSDPEKVDACQQSSNSETRTASDKPSSSRKSTSTKVSGIATPPGPEPRQNHHYDDLSNVLRSNFFPGITCDQMSSTTHRNHHPDVYKRRDDIPSQFRFQWDHVSRWNEANVLHSRLLKDFDTKTAAK